MATTLVSVEEYLSTSYPDGDREYVDGRIVERNVGEVDHADAQSNTYFYIRAHYRDVWAAVEVRVQVKPARFRVPDVTVVAGPKPETRIVTAPPLIVVEVISPDDRINDLQDKIDDYLAFGIPNVWVINPYLRRAYVHTAEGPREVRDTLRTADPVIELPLAEIFGRA